jgi:hypothetical protein
VLGEQPLDRVDAERMPLPGREYRVGNGAGPLAHPGVQHGHGLAGEWGGAFLAALAVAFHVRAVAEVQAGDGEPGKFADPQPGLDGQDEQGVVATPEPGGPVGCSEQRVDLGGGEEADQRAVVAFGRDGQHPLNQAGVLGVAQRGVAEQRMDRRQAGVAGTHPVAPIAFEIGEERSDELGVEIGQVEPAGWCAGALLREAQQQPQRVAVCGQGSRAGLALGYQPVGEERLQGRGEGAHHRSPAACSSRSAASASRSGAAERYQ